MVERLKREPLQEELKENEERKQKEPILIASMVFLGITGAGKSTLMQAIKDFVLEKDYNQRSEIVKTQKDGESETRKIEEHKLRGPKWDVRIIDTPGLADTRGPEQDEQTIKDLVEKLIKYGKFHAFCFVMNAGDNRKTKQFEQTYKALKYLLPEKLGNFVLCITKSSLPCMSQDLEGIVKSLGLPMKNIFLFDNRAYEITLGEQNVKEGEIKYKNSQRKIQKFLSTASQLIPYQSEGHRQLHMQKNKVVAILKYLHIQRMDCLLNLRNKSHAYKYIHGQKVSIKEKGERRAPIDYNFIYQYLTLSNQDPAINGNEDSVFKKNNVIDGRANIESMFRYASCGEVEIDEHNNEEFTITMFGRSYTNDLLEMPIEDYFKEDSSKSDNLKGVIVGAATILVSPIVGAFSAGGMILNKLDNNFDCYKCGYHNIYHTLYTFCDDCINIKDRIMLGHDDYINQLELIEKVIKDCFECLSKIPLIGYQYDYIQYLQYYIWRTSNRFFDFDYDSKIQTEYLHQHLEKIYLKETQLFQGSDERQSK